MRDYALQIERVKKKLVFLQEENFSVAPSGTNHKVFISKNFVIRFRDNNPKILLLREASFLQKLEHPLIPKVLWAGEFDGSTAMVENRLPGKNIDLVWKKLSLSSKVSIIKQLVTFLQYLKTQTRSYVYSVHTGKKQVRFFSYLLAGTRQKAAQIKKFKQANEALKDILSVINEREIKVLFTHDTTITLIHGDLLIHNLLAKGKNLTGVLDWEFALFGDPDYDLFRLYYYQECARAYEKKGVDEIFEADYMNKLISAIQKSSLIKNKKLFQKKYRFTRAIFYLNALDWATKSDNPQKNIDELVGLWNKKRS